MITTDLNNVKVESIFLGVSHFKISYEVLMTF